MIDPNVNHVYIYHIYFFKHLFSFLCKGVHLMIPINAWSEAKNFYDFLNYFVTDIFYVLIFLSYFISGARNSLLMVFLVCLFYL